MGYFNFPRMQMLQDLTEDFADVAEKCFVTSRPATVPEQLQSYAVIRNSSGIRDRGDTYQTAKLSVYLFARDRKGQSGNIENSWRLEQMQSALCAKCPIIHDRFTASNPNIIGSGSDAGFHYLVIQLSITINKKTL